MSGTSGGVPALRVRRVNGGEVRPSGAFVLYWMTAFRRTSWNFALDRAAQWSRELGRPLLVLEALRCDYPYASHRFHRFVLDGMADNLARCREAGVACHAYVEPAPGAGKGLLEALGQHACLAVADDFPGFFLPRMVAAAGLRLPVLLEAVDSNGLLPLRAADRAFSRAFDFRRFLQRRFGEHGALPASDPLRGLSGHARVPEEVLRLWPAAPASLLEAGGDLSRLPLDPSVAPVPLRGGELEGRRRLRSFVEERLHRYADDRNHPDRDATSGLSPYLHFGHVSAHEVFAAVMARERWSADRLGSGASGSRTGWWGVGPSAEAFLDQLVTWREIGFNGCAHAEGWDRYESLPAWAQATLEKHARDRRAPRYGIDELRAARTHDPLWNAAQTQLRREGRLHNYLRMLWGKKILEWTPGPREALAAMLELNDRYALDGRDPNSLSGIFWCLGRYDRAWGPERPVFGTVRYMSSENTLRKVAVRRYLAVYGTP